MPARLPEDPVKRRKRRSDAGSRIVNRLAWADAEEVMPNATETA